jgi:simple sugar transport system permease protein
VVFSLIGPLAALFLAYLRIGGDIMMRRTGVQMEIIKVVQALLIVLLVAERFLSSYRHKMVVKDAMAKEAGADA